MKNRFRLIVLALIIAAVAVSCKKDEMDVTAPVITIEEPTMHLYTIDSTATSVDIPVKIAITDNADLHEMSLEIENTTDSEEVFHIHEHLDVDSYTLDTTLTFSYTMMKDHTITITAEDHSGNSATETKDFHVHVE